MSWDRGIVLKWNEPKNPNGLIHYYTIEWTLHDVTHSANVTECSFKFPNTLTTDRFNITVRAIGDGGVGNPLHTYPDRWRNFAPINAQSTKFDPIMIFAIIPPDLKSLEKMALPGSLARKRYPNPGHYRW